MCRGWKTADCCSILPVTPRRRQLSPVSAAAISVFCLCPPRGSCQVSSFWHAFTSLNDSWQQWKATENCLLIRAKLVDETDEVVSQRCGHVQVMTFAPRAQEPNRIQLHYIMPLALIARSPAPDCFVYVVMRTIYLCWFQCLPTPICSWALQTTCDSVLTNTPRDTEVSISPKSNCAVLKKKKNRITI